MHVYAIKPAPRPKRRAATEGLVEQTPESLVELRADRRRFPNEETAMPTQVMEDLFAGGVKDIRHAA